MVMQFPQLFRTRFGELDPVSPALQPMIGIFHIPLPHPSGRKIVLESQIEVLPALIVFRGFERVITGKVFVDTA